MAGEDGGNFFICGEAAGAGVGEATVDASGFSVGGVVFASREGNFDLCRVGGELGLGFRGP